jgi:hypothetical protein
MTAGHDERAFVELQLAALRGAEAFQKKVAALVREAMNRAAGAVMFDKPPAAVSANERAAAEMADYIVVGDRPKSDKARRAAHAAALQVLAEHGLIPPKMADYAADVFDKLNASVVEGYARPAPGKARKGGVWRDNFAVAVADETNHTIGLHGVSRERALTIVSGVKRPTAEGKAPPRAAIPLPLSEAAPAAAWSPVGRGNRRSAFSTGAKNVSATSASAMHEPKASPPVMAIRWMKPMPPPEKSD